MELGALQKKSGAPAPRYEYVKIVHADAEYRLPSAWTFSGQVSHGTGFTAVALGLIRSRSMWPREFGTGKILCQSADAEVGEPSDDFPWGQFKGDETPDSKPGQKLLDCGSCNFTHFHKTRPMCGEEWTIPLVGPNTEKVMLLKFGRSALPMLKEYLGPFRDKREPLYSTWTTFTLDAQSRKGNVYSTPALRRSHPTYEQDWPWFSARLAEVRDWLQAPSPETPAITPLSMG